ncbi:MAG: radical SAM protein [Candidatus Margulisiibacteriota bacterium]
MNTTPARLDVSIKSYGKATALLNAMRQDPVVTFILTTRCDLTCKHCFSPKPERPIDLDLDLVKSTAEELRGLSRLYWSGGEPFQYMAGERDHEQIFMDLVHHTANQVDQLCIDTNGMFLPAELDSAKNFLGQFPNNTIFVLSLDPYHAEAIAKRGRSLKQISDTLAEACSANGLRMEANIRLPRGEQDASRQVIKEFGPSRYSRDFQVYLNALYSQGEAQQLPASDTKLVSLSDVVEHAGIISDIGLFVSPRGHVIGGEHAAFLSTPPAFAVMGDLHTHTLAGLLWEALCGHAYSGERSAYFSERSGYVDQDTATPFSRKEVERISRHYTGHRPQRAPDMSQVVALVSDKLMPIDWKVDLTPDNTDSVLLNFGRETIEGIIRQAARKFTDDLLQLRQDRGARVNFAYAIRKGAPVLEVELQRIGRESTPGDFRLFVTGLFGREGYLAREGYGCSPDWKKQLFIESMYERAKDQLSQARDADSYRYAQILLEEIMERCQGAHAEEIIAIIKNGSLAFDWVIKLYGHDGSQLSLGILNRRILESYQETQEIGIQTGPGFIKSLLRVDEDCAEKKKGVCLEARIRGDRLIFDIST